MKSKNYLPHLGLALVCTTAHVSMAAPQSKSVEATRRVVIPAPKSPPVAKLTSTIVADNNGPNLVLTVDGKGNVLNAIARNGESVIKVRVGGQDNMATIKIPGSYVAPIQKKGSETANFVTIRNVQQPGEEAYVVIRISSPAKPQAPVSSQATASQTAPAKPLPKVTPVKQAKADSSEVNGEY